MRDDVMARESLAPLLLRLALGVILIYHGLDKVRPPNDWGAIWAANIWAAQGRAPENVLEKIDATKVKGVSPGQLKELKEQVRAMYNQDVFIPEAMRLTVAQMAVAWGELLGGIALLLGALTRIAAAGVIVIQLGAIATVTFARGFSALNAGGGYEYNLALVAMCLTLVVLGAGALSVDRCLAQRRAARQQAVGAPAVGAPS